jgi:HAD superfamily hydrolase (TIGR01509 family)
MTRVLGLPSAIRACLFDLDGVLTQTAGLHAMAWKEMFDAFLRRRAEATGSAFPEGHPGDPPGTETVIGLGDRKNELVLALIRGGRVETYPGSLRYLRAADEAGLRRAVVSASKNAREILLATGIDDLFEEVIDGVVAEREHLSGKPAPDTFLAGARALGVEPAEAAVFEDALAGVEAGRAGDFGFVVGVNRSDQANELLEHGADVVVSDLEELLEQR